MTMTGTSRSFAAVLLAVPLVAATAPAATAAPFAGDDVRATTSAAERCQLRRVGEVLVRCDTVTGAGVPAPRWVRA